MFFDGPTSAVNPQLTGAAERAEGSERSHTQIEVELLGVAAAPAQ